MKCAYPCLAFECLVICSFLIAQDERIHVYFSLLLLFFSFVVFYSVFSTFLTEIKHMIFHDKIYVELQWFNMFIFWFLDIPILISPHFGFQAVITSVWKITLTTVRHFLPLFPIKNSRKKKSVVKRKVDLLKLNGKIILLIYAWRMCALVLKRSSLLTAFHFAGYQAVQSSGRVLSC